MFFVSFDSRALTSFQFFSYWFWIFSRRMKNWARFFFLRKEWLGKIFVDMCNTYCVSCSSVIILIRSQTRANQFNGDDSQNRKFFSPYLNFFLFWYVFSLGCVHCRLRKAKTPTIFKSHTHTLFLRSQKNLKSLKFWTKILKLFLRNNSLRKKNSHAELKFQPRRWKRLGMKEITYKSKLPMQIIWFVVSFFSFFIS